MEPQPQSHRLYALHSILRGLHGGGKVEVAGFHQELVDYFLASSLVTLNGPELRITEAGTWLVLELNATRAW